MIEFFFKINITNKNLYFIKIKFYIFFYKINLFLIYLKYEIEKLVIYLIFSWNLERFFDFK
jgi:hypothetical protein